MGTLAKYLIEVLLVVPGVMVFRRMSVSYLPLIVVVANLFYYFLMARNHLIYLVFYLAAVYLTYQVMVVFPRYKRNIFFLYVVVTLTAFVMSKLSYFKMMGFSFILLQNYAFLYSLSKKEKEDDLSFMEFFSISAFFPVVTAGPISSLVDIRKQIFDSPASLALSDIKWGSLRVLNAFFKKSLIDFIMALHFVGYNGDEAGKMNFPFSWLNMSLVLTYYYFDFSAISDLAIGSARILGVRIGENFRSPYTSYSVAEFWRRWHISLGQWFQSYFLLPIQMHFLRKPTFRRFAGPFNYAMVFVTFIAIGFWHGIGFRYLFWGVFNGAFVVFTHMYDGSIKRSKFLSFGSWVLMLVVVFVGQYILLTRGIGLEYREGTLYENTLALVYFILLFLVHAYDLFFLNDKILHWPLLSWGVGILQVMAVLVFFSPYTTFMYSDF